MPGCRYVEEIGLAGVIPEVNLRELLHIRLHQVRIRLPTLALKSRGDITRSPKKRPLDTFKFVYYEGRIVEKEGSRDPNGMHSCYNCVRKVHSLLVAYCVHF